MYSQIHQHSWTFSKLMSVKLMIQLFKKNNPTHPFRFDFPSLLNCFQLTYLQKPSLHMHINISICSAMKISFSQEPSIVLLSQYKMSKMMFMRSFFFRKIYFILNLLIFFTIYCLPNHGNIVRNIYPMKNPEKILCK